MNPVTRIRDVLDICVRKETLDFGIILRATRINETEIVQLNISKPIHVLLDSQNDISNKM